jgi:hypothetical protein
MTGGDAHQLAADPDQVVAGAGPPADGHDHAGAVVMRRDAPQPLPVAEPHGLADRGMADQ